MKGTPLMVVLALAACGVIVIQTLAPIAIDVFTSIVLVGIGGWAGYAARGSRS